MKHFTLTLRTLLCTLALLLTAGVGQAQTTVTFNAASDKGSSLTNVSKEGITISVTAGTLNNGSEYRFNAGQTVTISCESGTITKMVFTCTVAGTTKYGPGNFSVKENNGTYSYIDKVGTWEGSSNSIQLSTSQQVRAKTIELTINNGGSTDPEKTEAGLAYNPTAYTINLGDAFTAPTLTNPNTLTVTYASDNDGVAAVNATTGEVTLGGNTGTATITATSEENETYKAGEASYTITVVKPFDASGYKALVAEKNGEYFIASSNFTGKYAEAVSIPYVVNNKVINLADKEPYSWTVAMNDEQTQATIQNPEGKYLWLNASSAEVKLQTGEATIYVKDGNFYGAESTNRRFALNNNSGTNPIRFSTYLDNGGQYPAAVLMDFADGYVRAELNDGKVGTICLPRDVEADDVCGAKFYTVAGKTESALVLSEACGTLMAGQPYVFIADDTEIVAAYTGEAVAEAQSEGGLHGVFEKTTVAAGKYVINGNQLRKSNGASSVAANRAWVDLDEVADYQGPANAPGLVFFGFDGTTTGIGALESATTQAKAYDLGGRRVKATAKGLYIVDGRKVIVK